MSQTHSISAPPASPISPAAWPDVRATHAIATPAAAPSRVRMELQIDLHYDIDAHGADFIFNIHAAETPGQSVSAERLVINQDIATHIHTDPATRNRYLRLHGEPGPLQLSYCATVDITHHRSNPVQLAEVTVRYLPHDVLGYIYPSRYCQSDRLLRLAMNLNPAVAAMRRADSRALAGTYAVLAHSPYG